MARYVGALDQGTTSTRFMIFDHQGRVVASHQLEHRQIFPRPGWVEHDPLEIWARTQEVIQGAMSRGQLQSSELAAIGITNQRETTVVWNRHSGQPYHNALVWQDTRTDAICRTLVEDHPEGQDRFRKTSGLPVSTYFSAPKIRWLLDEVEGLKDAAERGDALFGNIDTWLIWNLTGGAKDGVHITDVSNASRTMAMDLSRLAWDEEILDVLQIPGSMLPRIRPSSDPDLYGKTKSDGPLGGEVPLCGDLGDQQAALFGQTCFDAGEAKNTYGTGCFMLLNTGNEPVPSRCGLLTTVGYQLAEAAPVYALEGSIAIAGALVQWLRDNLGLISESEEIEALASSVEDSGGIYFVPAFSGLFAPHWKSDARGVVVGLTRFINKGHLARAALEATAYQTREVLEAMRTDSGVDLRTLKVDGGMVGNELLMQFQADVLGVPVVRPAVKETTSLGAAYAAGLAVGFWNGTEDLRVNWSVDQEWTPRMDEQRRARDYRGWQKAVQRSLDWVE